MRLALCALAVLIGLFGNSASADVTYEYDALGRLVRVVDEQGRIAVYVYGPTGNLIQILRDGAPQSAPTVTSVQPGLVRQGQPRQVRLIGTNLLGANVTSTDSALRLTVEQPGQTELLVRVVTAVGAALGPRTLTVANNVGSTTASVEVRAPLILSTAPGPIVLPPDSLAHAVVVRLSETEPLSTTFKVNGSATSVATITSSTATLPAGQTEFQIAVRGSQPGSSSFTVSSAAIGLDQRIPVYVAPNSAPVSGVLGVYLPAPGPSNALLTAANTGVFLPTSPSSSPLLLPGSNVGVMFAPNPSSAVLLPTPNVGVLLPSSMQGTPVLGSGSLLGVGYGAVPMNIAPNTVSVGTTSALTISGYALGAVTSIGLTPSSGTTVGALEVSPDGAQITFPLSVACNATVQPREVVVSAASGRIEFSTQQAASLKVTAAPPMVSSVQPATAAVGTSQTLVLGGLNLACATSVLAEPAGGITFTTSPTVNATGTELSIGLSIASDASLGGRVLRVVTPTGTSSSTATSGNTLTLAP